MEPFAFLKLMEPDQRPEMSSARVSSADTNKHPNNRKTMSLLQAMTCKCFKDLGEEALCEPDTSLGGHPTGRVSERRCRHSLPSEPDMKVSIHPAQAVQKPRVS